MEERTESLIAAKRTSARWCDRCRKVLSHCICADADVMCNTLPVWILQHPDEYRHPLNTAVIAQAFLSRCRLWTGLDFSVHNPLCRQLATRFEHTYVLYPAPDAPVLGRDLSMQALPDMSMLLVLDGTWRNTRELLHRNPRLNRLRKVTLDSGASGAYHLRKSQRQDGLSTLEAVTHALESWEGCPGRYQPLRDVQQKMQARQLARMPADVAKRYETRIR